MASRWSLAALEAALHVQTELFGPYGRGSTGVTEDVWHEKDGISRVLLKKDDRGCSYCSGAQFQAFVRACRSCPPDPNFSFDFMNKARLAAYCRVDVDPAYSDGLPGFLVRSGAAEAIGVRESRRGDLMQITLDDSPTHAAIVVERDDVLFDGGDTVTEHPSGDGRDVVWAWSSNYSQPASPKSWPKRLRFRRSGRSGHMFDYFVVDKTNKDGKKRGFVVARPAWGREEVGR